MIVRKLLKSGDPFIWLTGGALATGLLMMAGLVALVATRALGIFWPVPVVYVRLADGTEALGAVRDREAIPGAPERHRILLQVGNRDIYGADFRWIDEANIVRRDLPPDAVVLERTEWGNLFGFVKEVRSGGAVAASGTNGGWAELERRRPRSGGGHALREDEAARDEAVFTVAGGAEVTIPIAKVVRAYRPNAMGMAAKMHLYGAKVVEFLIADPRESNTEGGVFPAIFGTVMMVLIMTVAVVPFGVLAALYLREYTRQGPMVRIVRIAVNNLAGVPSIVFGVFGLGFFVYFVGGGVDSLFFSERFPAPTYATGGILWASLTLAMLTVPVVVVATEEALAAVPKQNREGSLALGATHFQTVWRVVLPNALPGILTGMILAMARGAGEVAPLMITGVVKLAPDLPLDWNWPFLHLERKFMHLGFHIYDVGFQSPNVEAAKPMVYATTLLLVGIILALNMAAILIRNRLRRRFTAAAF